MWRQLGHSNFQGVASPSFLSWKWKWSRSVVSDSLQLPGLYLPGSSICGIFQARILEWVAISSLRESSWPKDWTRVSRIVGRCLTIWATREVVSALEGTLEVRLSYAISPSLHSMHSPSTGSTLSSRRAGGLRAPKIKAEVASPPKD